MNGKLTKFCKQLDIFFVLCAVGLNQNEISILCHSISQLNLFRINEKKMGRTNCASSNVTNQKMHVNIYFIVSYLPICFSRFCIIQKYKQCFIYTRSVNKIMRLIQYNSVLTFKLQIEFVPFKIVPLGGYTPPETLFPIFIATLVVANWNRF